MSLALNLAGSERLPYLWALSLNKRLHVYASLPRKLIPFLLSEWHTAIKRPGIPGFKHESEASA